jgi:hypothetical protein
MKGNSISENPAASPQDSSVTAGVGVLIPTSLKNGINKMISDPLTRLVQISIPFRVGHIYS